MKNDSNVIDKLEYANIKPIKQTLYKSLRLK